MSYVVKLSKVGSNRKKVHDIFYGASGLSHETVDSDLNKVISGQVVIVSEGLNREDAESLVQRFKQVGADAFHEIET